MRHQSEKFFAEVSFFMQKNVAVLFGGISCENEISVITGVMAANLLDGDRYSVHPVYIAQDGAFYTGKELLDTSAYAGNLSEKFRPAAILEGKLYERKGKKLREVCRIDCALNCCHGARGEDGAVSGLLDLNRIPCASPGIAPSAVFMDKSLTKLVARALNIPTAPWLRIAEEDFQKRGAFAVKCIEERLGYPVIVKPARQGSSIGVAVAEDRARLLLAIHAGFAYDTGLLAEKYFAERREINCAAYRKGDEIVLSPCEEPKTAHKFLTFADKYAESAKSMRSEFPAKIAKASAERIQGYTKLLYRRLGMVGVVRADFLISGGEVYFNEMNTVPGAMAWYLFSEKLADFRCVLTALVEQGICSERARAEKKLLSGCGVLRGAAARGKARQKGGAVR